MADEITKVDVEEYVGKERIDMVLKRWAAQSAKQLKDSMKLNKIYPYGEIWQARTKTWVDKKGKTRTKVERGWFHENAKRKARGGTSDWWSTGHSASVADDVKIIGTSLPEIILDYHTTLGALYAESGAGLAGKKHTRAARGSKGRERVKIDRTKNYSRDRYISEWVPLRGQVHRPSVRRQANLINRRLKWLATLIYTYNVASWIGYEVTDTLYAGAGLFKKHSGVGGEVVLKPSRKRKQNDVKVTIMKK